MLQDFSRLCSFTGAVSQVPGLKWRSRTVEVELAHGFSEKESDSSVKKPLLQRFCRAAQGLEKLLGPARH